MGAPALARVALRPGAGRRYVDCMSVRSMTGFGAASRGWQAPDGPLRVDVEIRSVNARFLELKIRQPFGSRLEPIIRGRAERRLGRGRVDLGIFVRRGVSVDAAPEDPLGLLGLDEHRVRATLMAARRVSALADEEELELSRPSPVEILRFLQSVNRAAAEAVPSPPPFVEELVDAALDELCGFREREGKALEQTLSALADDLQGQVRALAAELPAEVDRLMAQLCERVREVCERAGAQSPEPDRVAQEVALLVARGDVAEELARIDSHLAQMRMVLAEAPRAGQGKTLEFLSQELMREVTTIGSKITSHAGSRIVIDAKATIERIREQVQNVE